MSIEKSRADFLQMLAGDEFRSGPWLAICLFMPPEWLHELRLSISDNDRIISYGRDVLSILGEGFFTRIGWTSYLSIVLGDKLTMEEKLNDEIIRLQLVDGYCGRWRYAVAEVGNQEPLVLVSKLVVASHEKAREEGKDLG